MDVGKDRDGFFSSNRSSRRVATISKKVGGKLRRGFFGNACGAAFFHLEVSHPLTIPISSKNFCKDTSKFLKRQISGIFFFILPEQIFFLSLQKINKHETDHERMCFKGTSRQGG